MPKLAVAFQHGSDAALVAVHCALLFLVHCELACDVVKTGKTSVSRQWIHNRSASHIPDVLALLRATAIVLVAVLASVVIVITRSA